MMRSGEYNCVESLGIEHITVIGIGLRLVFARSIGAQFLIYISYGNQAGSLVVRQVLGMSFADASETNNGGAKRSHDCPSIQ